MKTNLLYKVMGSTTTAVLVLAAGSAAHAQSIDYGSLQQLFDEPVTTSATGSPQRSTEAPADMQIITADDIRRSGETGLPGILQRVAGMDVLNHSAGHSDVNLRGYDQISAPRLLVLVNGRQVYLDHYGVTMWSSIPVQLDEIRQIEVVKGPNAALFGFNAVSGVVNIITYNPKYDDTDVVTVRGGNGNFGDASLVSTFKLGQRVSARLSVGGQKRGEWEKRTTVVGANGLHDLERAAATFDMVAQLGEKTDLRLEGAWSNAVTDSLISSSYSTIKTLTSSGKATLVSDTSFGLVQAQAYQNQATMKYNFAGSTVWKNVISVASIQDIFKVGANHSFRVSAEYRRNKLNTAPVKGGEVSYDVLSAAGMWNWALTPQVTATTALRFDDMSLDRSGTFSPGIVFNNNAMWDRKVSETSANFTLAWRPDSDNTAKFSYGRGVQVPSLIEYGAVVLPVALAPGFVVDLTGSPFIKPTLVTDYQFSYDRRFSKAEIGLRLFRQKWSDIKSSLSTTSGLDAAPTLATHGAIFYTNASDSEMDGVEFKASGKLGNGFGWHGDYTYTHIKDKPFTGVNAMAKQVAFARTTPEGRGNLGGTWVSGPWEVDGNLHYVSDYEFYDPATGTLQPVKAYGAVSSRVGRSFKNGVVLAVSGQNLMNARQKQTRGLQAERQLVVSISKSW